MVIGYSPQVSPEKISYDDYEASLPADLDLESPCSLDSEMGETDEQTQDTFDFTEGEEETLQDDRSSLYYWSAIEENAFQPCLSDGSIDDMDLAQGG